MKKKLLSKTYYIMVFIIFILLTMGIKVNASSINVSTSKTSVSPGESFTVTVSVSGGAGYVSATTSNGTGYLGSTWLDSSSTTFSCKAGSSGTVSISASGLIADYSTEQDENKYGSAKVTIIQPTTPSNDSKDPAVGSTPAKNPTNTTKPTPKPASEQEKKSNDATLDSLTIAEGTFTPEFNKNVKEYTMEVENDITELNVTANLSDYKAAVTVEGNKELKVGENIVTIKVTAEDGTVAEYIVKVNRKRENLALKSLKIYYLDENNEIQELLFTPEFDKEVFEYKVDNLSYIINSLNIEAVANIEEAVIEVIGNEDLKEGENVITIKITIPAQNEGEEDDVLVYTIKINKEPAPVLTLMGRIKNWFGRIGTAISTWYTNNQYIITMTSLTLCSACMGGLTVYLIMDYKKYKKLIEKVAEITKLNNSNENFVQETNSIELNNEEQNLLTDEELENKEIKSKGRHF